VSFDARRAVATMHSRSNLRQAEVIAMSLAKPQIKRLLV
jgi:hypothetical protein